MNVDVVKIAETWSYWDSEIPETVPREVELPDELRDSICLVIQGVRRCGKSTLMSQLVERYSLEPGHCAFLNLEDPRLSQHLTFELLGELVRRFRAARPGAEKLYFFLDEIQVVEGWEKWLRSQLERPADNHFVITGSNARLLSGELASSLTGRHLTVELFPFEIEEARALMGDVSVTDYLQGGGFPEPLQMADRDMLLRQYFRDIVERDVRERAGARSSAPVLRVAQMAYEAAGSELSLRRIAGATGMAVETAAGYLAACRDAYLLFDCPYFAYSERKRANRNSKYYPVDTGLRRVNVTPTGEDLGKSLECAVFLKLRRKYSDVSYWRDDGEVDFVVREGKRVFPIQVTWDEPKERHHAALEAFYERFPHAGEGVFVTAENFEDVL